jgi:hypothetical protein
MIFHLENHWTWIFFWEKKNGQDSGIIIRLFITIPHQIMPRDAFFFFIIYKILGLRLFYTMHYYYLILFPFSKYLLLSLCLINLELKKKMSFFFNLNSSIFMKNKSQLIEKIPMNYFNLSKIKIDIRFFFSCLLKPYQ